MLEKPLRLAIKNYASLQKFEYTIQGDLKTLNVESVSILKYSQIKELRVWLFFYFKFLDRVQITGSAGFFSDFESL